MIKIQLARELDHEYLGHDNAYRSSLFKGFLYKTHRVHACPKRMGAAAVADQLIYLLVICRIDFHYLLQTVDNF